MISRLKQFVTAKIHRYLKFNGYVYPDIRRYDKMTRFFHLKELYDKIETVPGDVVECGVAFGYSLIVLSTLVKQEGKGRAVYGFDSFAGFPEPTLEDKSVRDTRKGEHGNSTIDRVKKIISHADVPTPTLVKGFLEHTLPPFRFDRPIAFLHIDVDLYSGYKTALDVLYEKIPVGGVIAFDEYNEPKWPGATKAINEFLAQKKQTIEKARYVNKCFVVKR